MKHCKYCGQPLVIITSRVTGAKLCSQCYNVIAFKGDK